MSIYLRGMHPVSVDKLCNRQNKSLLLVSAKPLFTRQFKYDSRQKAEYFLLVDVIYHSYTTKRYRFSFSNNTYFAYLFPERSIDLGVKT